MKEPGMISFSPLSSQWYYICKDNKLDPKLPAPAWMSDKARSICPICQEEIGWNSEYVATGKIGEVLKHLRCL